MTAESIREFATVAERPAVVAPSPTPALRAVTAHELLSMQIPVRELVLDPWLPTQGLALVYSKRGVGKTHLALGIGYAVASGGRFLNWHAPRPRRVLYVDGEMPAVAIQERMAALAKSADAEPANPDLFHLVTPDLQEQGIPDLASKDGQRVLESLLAGVDLLIIDNLSTLCRSGKENEGEGWLPVQEWALQLRRRGMSVLFVHHAGKGGQQRGTSRREDVLDTVICLKHPSDYCPDQGARFEVHFEKCRALHGEAAKPFEASLMKKGHGDSIWAVRDLEDCLTNRVADLLKEGLSQHNAAKELGVGAGTINRHAKKARALGLLEGV